MSMTQTVPAGFTYHTWIAGICLILLINNFFKLFILGKEDFFDMLRSILAQFECRNLINEYVSEGVLFNAHLHVPDVYPATGTVICMREDEGHLLKVHVFCKSVV